MANEEHLRVLGQNKNILNRAESWNKWRGENPTITPDLSGANLDGAHLENVDLHGALLTNTYLGEARLRGSNLRGANLRKANLSLANLVESILIRSNLNDAFLNNTLLDRANLTDARLRGADLSNASLRDANLSGADLSGARLVGTDLSGTDLNDTDFTGANLTGAQLIAARLTGTIFTESNLHSADLSLSTLAHANFTNADLSNCRIFGISSRESILENAIQMNLIITQEGDPIITVDDLEIAQFIYLLLHNEKIRQVIDTITSKVVLILGRFTDGRKAVLEAIRDELRKQNYTPILFDFDKPANRDLTETIMTLAGMARFVITDLSDPNSIPHELMSFAEKLLSVPVQAIFCPTAEHPKPYPKYEHLQRYPHVLPIFRYDTQENLIAVLYEKVIQPAEQKVIEMRPNNSL